MYSLRFKNPLHTCTTWPSFIFSPSQVMSVNTWYTNTWVLISHRAVFMSKMALAEVWKAVRAHWALRRLVGPDTGEFSLWLTPPGLLHLTLYQPSRSSHRIDQSRLFTPCISVWGSDDSCPWPHHWWLSWEISSVHTWVLKGCHSAITAPFLVTIQPPENLYWNVSVNTDCIWPKARC